MQFHLFFRRVVLAMAASAGVLLFCPKSEAAERVVLKYRTLQASVSVSELATFVQTGELSPRLQSYLKLARRNPEEVRQILKREVRINSTLLEGVLNTQMGQKMLDRVVQVVYSSGEQTNQQALRSALVKSALGDGKITLIEALQNYPTPEVQVDGDRLAQVITEAYRQIPVLADHLPKRQ